MDWEGRGNPDGERRRLVPRRPELGVARSCPIMAAQPLQERDRQQSSKGTSQQRKKKNTFVFFFTFSSGVVARG